MGDVINILEENTILGNNDFLVFDVLSSHIGQFNTKKISFLNFSKTLSSALINAIPTKFDSLSTSISNFQSNLSYKLDKRGLSYSNNEKITGPLNVNAVLSCFGSANFSKDINSNVNRILNLSGQFLNDSDAVNKEYVDNLFSGFPNIDMSLFVLRSGDRMTGNLVLTSNSFNTNDIVNKNYIDNIFVNNNFIPISGGNLTGYLSVLDPTDNNHVVSKKYVDSLSLSASDYLPISGGILNGFLTVLSPTFSSHTSTKKYVDNLEASYVKTTGSKVTPNFVTLNYSLENSFLNSSITKKYVDDTFNGLNLFVPTTGNKALTGNLITHDIFTSKNEVVNKNYVDLMIPSSNVFLSGGIASNTQLKRFTEKLTTINHSTESNISLNVNYKNSFFINLNANCTGFDISNINPNNVYYLTINVLQKKTSSPFANIIWTVNGSTILWEKGNASIPIITPTVDKLDTFTLIHKTGTWYGINAGQNR